MEKNINMIELIQNLYNRNIEIMKAKNQDYSGNNPDPLYNFTLSAGVANVSVQQGILVRLMDKMARIGNLLNQEAAVKDETISDTISDAINYLSILYYSLNKDKNENSKRN